MLERVEGILGILQVLLLLRLIKLCETTRVLEEIQKQRAGWNRLFVFLDYLQNVYASFNFSKQINACV